MKTKNTTVSMILRIIVVLQKSIHHHAAVFNILYPLCCHVLENFKNYGLGMQRVESAQSRYVLDNMLCKNPLIFMLVIFFLVSISGKLFKYSEDKGNTYLL